MSAYPAGCRTRCAFVGAAVTILKSIGTFLVGLSETMERQQAYRDALRGEYGPTAQHEAEAWEWAMSEAVRYPFSGAQMRYLLSIAGGDQRAAIFNAGSMCESGLHCPSASEPTLRSFVNMAKLDAVHGRWPQRKN